MKAEYQMLHKIQSREIGANGLWQPSQVFMAMQDLADEHGVMLGLSRDDTAKMGMAWIVARSSIYMREYPKMFETIVCQTWTGRAERVGALRSFSFTRQDGTLLGYGVNVWVLVDVITHKLIMRPNFDAAPPASDKPVPLEVPGRILWHGANQPEEKRRISFSDLDINVHMNNARYVQWICDLFSVERMGQGLRHLQINYRKEGMPHQLLTLQRFEDGQNFTLRGLEENGSVVFEATGVFASEQG